jgi:hypothetical protein
MSGLLEQILAELQAIRLAVSSNAGIQPNGGMPVQQPNVPVHQPVQPQVDPFAAANPVQPVQPQVTDAMVMALIEPHLANAAVKAALQGVLTQMGIPRLPDARPDQLNDLYARFQAAIAQTAGAAAQPTGII